MITCCEIALVLSITNIITLAIFANYTIKLKHKSLLLEKEVKDIERVNGKEKQDIKDLQTKVKGLESKLDQKQRF